MFDRRQILLKLLELFDLVVMIGCFGLATWFSLYWENGESSFREFLSMGVKIQDVALFLALIGTWHLFFSAFRLYHSRRLAALRDEIFNLLKAITLGALLLAAAAIILDLSMITARFLVFFWTAASVILTLMRLGLRHLLA